MFLVHLTSAVVVAAAFWFAELLEHQEGLPAMDASDTSLSFPIVLMGTFHAKRMVNQSFVLTVCHLVTKD